ncbi:MAG: MFS transporter [Erysipelotrichaceae bacterium]|jgi:MFS family permease|nr:MFS transporter [Erysipelotrichaceae bacterium]
MKKQGNFMYVLVAVCTCLMACGAMGMVNAYGVFYKPMADSMQVGQGSITLHMSISNLIVGLGTPFVAKMISRNVRIKNILMAGAILIILSGFGIALAPNTLLMNIAAAVRGVGFAAVSMMIITMFIGNWFVRYRGTLTGIALSFSGIGSAIASPILSKLIESFGWQRTYIGYVIFIVLCIIPSLLFVPLKPQDIGLRPLGENDAQEGNAKTAPANLDLPYTAKSPLFAALVVLVLCIVLLTSLSPHLSSLAQAYGYAASAGAALLSASMIGNVASKFLLGALSDKIGAFRGVILMLGTSVAGLVLILLNPGGTLPLMAGGFLYGTCFSIGSLGISMITRTIYGDKQYGQAYSVITLMTSVASAIGLTLIGFLYDATGSYAVSVIGGIVLAAVSLASLLFIQSQAKRKAA